MKNEPAGDDVEQDRDPDRARGSLPDIAPDTFQCDKISEDKYAERVANLEGRMSSTGRRMEYLTAVIAAITLAGVAVAYLQWDAIRGGGEQTDRLIAQVTAQAEAANQLAIAAEKTLAESRDHSQRALRPYLLPTIEPGPLVSGEPMKARYYFVNYGQTPALKTYSITGIFVGRTAMKEAEKWFSDQSTQIYETNAGASIPPGVPSGRNNEKFISIPSKRSITAQEIAAISERDYFVVITSRHIYRDGFGSTYGTETCHMMTKTWEAAYCPSHNEMH